MKNSWNKTWLPQWNLENLGNQWVYLQKIKIVQIMHILSTKIIQTCKRENKLKFYWF